MSRDALPGVHPAARPFPRHQRVWRLLLRRVGGVSSSGQLPPSLDVASDSGRSGVRKETEGSARQAEAEGCPEVALGFWRKAYELDLGHAPPADGADDEPVPISAPPKPKSDIQEEALEQTGDVRAVDAPMEALKDDE